MSTNKPKQTQSQRQFLGKLFVELDHSTPETLAKTKDDRNFNQKMLKAYLKGKSFFNYGFSVNISGLRTPMPHLVLQQYN